jgi:DMSO/TMAO reductase YedYZ molybdopterin-dependent catalytic subunit
MPEEKIIKSPDTLRPNRIPPGQHVIDNWPVLHEGETPAIDTTKWQFRIFGLVAQAKNLSYKEFISLPMVKVLSDIHCVTTWSKLDNLWEGVSANAIKEAAKPLPEARFVIIHADNDFTTNLTLDDFFAEDVLFAVKHNDKPLAAEHGGPVRLVVPRLYFWKSAKWVSGVEFTADDRPGFWESRGYHNHGDPWKEERRSR